HHVARHRLHLGPDESRSQAARLVTWVERPRERAQHRSRQAGRLANTGMPPLATVARDTLAVHGVVGALGRDARARDTRRRRLVQRTRQTTKPAVTEIRLEIDTQLAATRPVACILARARRRRAPSAGSPGPGATSTSPGASPDGPQSSRTPRAGVVA